MLSMDISLSLVPCGIKGGKTCFFKDMEKEFEGVKVLIADSAYDSRKNFNLISQQVLSLLLKCVKIHQPAQEALL